MSTRVLGRAAAFTPGRTITNPSGEFDMERTYTHTQEQSYKGNIYDIIYGSAGTRTEVAGQLRNLHVEKSTDSVIFPTNLHEVDNFVAFSISKEWKWKRDELSKDEIFKTIYLPIPSNLSTGYDAGWSGDDLGVGGDIGAAVAGHIKDFANGPGGIEGIKAAAASVYNSVANISTSQAKGIAANLATQVAESEIAPALGAGIGSLFRSSMVGGLATTIAQNAFKGAMGAAGIARNPHRALLFQGVDFRKHTFAYRLTPESFEESQILREIIGLFKYHMSPNYILGNQMFEYPETFDINFQHEKYLFNIGNSVLTNFDVNYHAENAPLYHNTPEGKTPFSVTLSMTFMETTITTKESILNDAR